MEEEGKKKNNETVNENSIKNSSLKDNIENIKKKASENLKIKKVSGGSPNDPERKKMIIMAACVLMTFLILFCVYRSVQDHKDKKTEVTYSTFLEYIENNEVRLVEYDESEEKIVFYIGEEIEGGEGKEEENKDQWTKKRTENPRYDDFKKDVLEAGVVVKEVKSFNSYASKIVSFMPITIMVIFLFIFIKSVGGEDIFGDGGASTKDAKSNLTFKNVAGLNELKQDLLTVVDFMKDPKKYTSAGAKLPKGIMLYGPPGTGKTLLAKAVAGEAKINFIAAVGSEFDEKFVGVGAQRIRKLFADARKKAPCIIFIDEIDALGGKRTEKSSSHDRQTINQLLSEMDGFKQDEGIMVIAATNRLEDLDPALVRPGRFDSQFAVPLPANSEDRLAIINIYADNKKFAEDVDFDLLAKETLGCSPADIEAIMNEAAIIAATESNGIITRKAIDDAFYKQVMKGHKKKDLKRKEEEKKLTAYHESGHALLGLIFNQDVTKVTIVPSTSGAGGVTFFNQQKLGMYSKEELRQEVMVIYAGRCAEQMLVGEDKITTGASNDITQASNIIKSMITQYGMSEYGLLDLSVMDIDNKEVVTLASKTSKQLYQEALTLMNEHKDDLELLATTLLEKETMTGEEIKALIPTL